MIIQILGILAVIVGMLVAVIALAVLLTLSLTVNAIGAVIMCKKHSKTTSSHKTSSLEANSQEHNYQELQVMAFVPSIPIIRTMKICYMSKA